MVDAFSLSAADSDRQIQLLIDSDLRNSQIEDARYPALLATQDCRAWVMPLLRRLAWHDAHAENDTVWTRPLVQMLEIALRTVRRLHETEFIALTDQLEKHGSLSASAIDAIAKLRRTLNAPVSRWSARLHRDIVSMEPKRRLLWLSALADAPSDCRLAVIHRLGTAELEDGLQRWIALLSDGAAAKLTPADTFVFQHVIALCDHLGGPAGGQFLYDIALAPWQQEPEHAWMCAYLSAIDRLSPDRAFACLEALMRNPSTALPDVRRRYDALLAMSGADAVAAAPIEVDAQLFRMAAELNGCQRPVPQHQAAEDGVAAR